MPVLAYAELDFFGLIILFLFYINQRRSGCFAFDDRLINAILLIGMFVLLLDGVLWLLNSVIYPGSHAVLIGLTSLSFIINPSLSCLWLFYCDLRIYSDERRLKKNLLLYGFPFFINILLTICNLFTPLVFSIDNGNAYHRESLFFIYLAVFYAYLLWAVFLVLRKIKRCDSPVERRDLWVLVFFSVPPIVGSILQSFFYGTSFTWPSVVISYVIVYIYVLNRQISTDSLTGLNNRRMLQRYLDYKVTSIEAGPPLFLIMLDADDFKCINDTYGHATGDRALMQIAGILKALCNHQDCFLARLGGDEFVIVGRDYNGSMLETLASDIGTRVAAFNASGGEPYRLSLSIGTARFSPGTVDTTDALLIAADRNMYQAKADKKKALKDAKKGKE